MKRYLLAVILIVAIAFLPSCGSSNEDIKISLIGFGFMISFYLFIQFSEFVNRGPK